MIVILNIYQKNIEVVELCESQVANWTANNDGTSDRRGGQQMRSWPGYP